MEATLNLTADVTFTMLDDGSAVLREYGSIVASLFPTQIAQLRAFLDTPPGSAYPAHIDITERDIIDCVVRDALAAGYSISVDGDGMNDLKRSTDYAKITETIAACSETELCFWKEDLSRPLWVYFVHGNGAEVLTDYSDNDLTNAIVARATAKAEEAGA